MLNYTPTGYVVTMIGVMGRTLVPEPKVRIDFDQIVHRSPTSTPTINPCLL